MSRDGARRPTVWREPAAETEDYPGLFVHDGRVSGSITAGRSRLPLWAIVGAAVGEDWAAVERNWDTHGLTEDAFAEFLYNLLEQRGEFGRLLLILADAERRERSHWLTPWWETSTQRRRVLAQLRRCVAVLEG